MGELAGCSPHRRGRVCRQGPEPGETVAMGEAPEKWLAKVKVKAEAACFVLCLRGQTTCYVWAVLAQRLTKNLTKSKVRGSSAFCP